MDRSEKKRNALRASGMIMLTLAGCSAGRFYWIQYKKITSSR